MAAADLKNGVPIRFEIWISLGNLAETIVATWGIRRLFNGVPCEQLENFGQVFSVWRDPHTICFRAGRRKRERARWLWTAVESMVFCGRLGVPHCDAGDIELGP